MCMAAWLSQYKDIGVILVNPSSERRPFNHMSSQVIAAIALYLASTLDQAITVCFLLFQVTRFPLTNVQKPVEDFRSRAFPAQSAFM
ncbi:hypothetical protein ACFX15_034379 [Malus domestica]